MTNSNELRIGNLLEFSGDYFKVKSISQKIVGVDRNKGIVEFKPSELNTIPLTEEILLSCGFENETGSIFEIKIDNGWYLNWEQNYIFLNYKENECEISHRKIEHLHQLQNLYFELTGQELNTEGLI